jgi:hypothetical protein
MYFSPSSPYPPPGFSISPDEPGKLPDESDQAGIYAALIKYLYTHEEANGEPVQKFNTIYIIRSTDDRVGDPSLANLGPNILGEKVQEQVIQMLADNESKGTPRIEWMDWPEDAKSPWDIKTTRKDEAIVLFGNILLQGESGSWLASSGIFTTQGASGGSYYLTQESGEWQVKENKGVRWTRQ